MTSDNTVSGEMLACPFCGGPARIARLLSGPFVTCAVCGGETLCCTDEAKAIAVWNRRSTPARVSPLSGFNPSQGGN